MKPHDSANSRRLLKHFNASALGEGDLNAGANVLAGMALSLCNLLRPNSFVVSADGARVSIGSSFLVTGALSSALITDRVLGPLQGIQNNILDHVAQLGRAEAYRNEINTNAGMKLVPKPDGSDFEEDSIIEKIQAVGLDDNREVLFRRLFERPVGKAVSPIRENPLLFATAANPETVEVVLKTAHMGRPFFHMVLREQADGRKFAQVGRKVIDGYTLDLPIMRSVKGTWVISATASAT